MKLAIVAVVAIVLVLFGIAQPRDRTRDITVVVLVDAHYLAATPFTAIAEIVMGIGDADRVRARWQAGW